MHKRRCQATIPHNAFAAHCPSMAHRGRFSISKLGKYVSCTGTEIVPKADIDIASAVFDKNTRIKNQ
jgi:hypothetical protein